MREIQFNIYDDHGDGSYRWVVRENGDCDGCVDIVYEDGDEVVAEFLGLDELTAEAIAVSIIEIVEFFEQRKREAPQRLRDAT